MIARLRKRFIAITMCSVVLVLVVIMSVINIINFVRTDNSAAQMLNFLAANDGSFPDFDKASPQAAGDSRNPLDSQIGLQTGMSQETPYETRYFSVVFQSDGTLSSVNTGKIAAVSTTEAVNMAQQLAEREKTSGYLSSYKYLVVEQDDKTMYLFLDCSRSLNSVRQFLMISILVSLCGIAGVLLLVVGLSRRATRPVAESYEKQKQFITNAGHELKTPLTIIDSCTEVIEMEQGESKWTQGIRGQVRRMDSMTKSLVALARMDERGENLSMKWFSLSDLLTETLEPFVLMAENKGKRFILQVQPHIMYRGDEPYIQQLISILADNAVKYSSDGGEICFSLKKKGSKCIMTCKNEADGLKIGNMDILFDRFYRGDASRNSQSGGFGIGLSMAQSIVLAHSGKISAKSDDGSHLLISVQL